MAEQQPHTETTPDFPVVDEGVYGALRHDFVKDNGYIGRNFHELNEANHGLAQEITYERSGGNVERKAGFVEGAQYIIEALKRPERAKQISAELFGSNTVDIQEIEPKREAKTRGLRRVLSKPAAAMIMFGLFFHGRPKNKENLYL
jgi:hypothetical protein